MAFQVSPGVLVTEKDLTNVIPAVSTSAGAIVLTAEKGPIDEITTISSESELVTTFGKPNSDNFEEFFCCKLFRLRKQSEGSKTDNRHGKCCCIRYCYLN